MKRSICLVLMMGSILSAGERRLVMNGGLGFSVKKTDIDNKKISEYPDDLSYGIDIATTGKFGKQTIGGILSLTYDELKKADIENINISLSSEKTDLTIGDVAESPSLLSLNTMNLRGIIGKTKRANKNIMLFIGRSQEKDEEYGQYRQYLGGFSIDATINKVKLGGVYLEAKDDKNSIASSTTSPIFNQVIGLNSSIPIQEAISLDAEVCFSRYDTDTTKKGDCDQKAFKISAETQKENLEVSLGYSYIEPNFYSAANTFLSTDRKKGELFLKYSKDIVEAGLSYNLYDDNLDKKKSFTTRTKKAELNLSLFPKRFLEEIEIKYKITLDKAKTSSPTVNRENEIISLSLSRAFSGIDSSLSYERGKGDDKVNNTMDSKSSLFSVNISGDLRKDLFTSLYFYSSFYDQTQKTRQDSYSISLTYEPKTWIRITPGYNYCQTKEDEKKQLLERSFSLETIWYLSSKHQLTVACQGMEKRDSITPSNDYTGTQAELKLTTLF
ncbi:hypothetical protein KJ640_02040 [bacterium]|nr:hypothetical protein [bacterium]